MKSSRSSSDASNDSDDDIIDKKRVLEDAKKKIKKDKNKKKDKGKANKKEGGKKSKDKKKKKEKVKKPKWGRYGVIKFNKLYKESTTDLYQRREEFMMWLSEIKCFNIETLSQQDERRYFEEYVECYNTATLPSQKYYNFKVWFDKEQHRGRKKSQEIEMSVFDDEAQKKQIENVLIIRLGRSSLNRKICSEIKELVNNTKHYMNAKIQYIIIFYHKAAEMQEKQQLQELMRHQYLVGNHEAALKIHKQLEPRRPVIVSGDTSSQEY